MPLSPNIKIKYPAENKQNWYSDFVTMVNTIDTKLFAAREDRNLLFSGGGTVAFDVVAPVGTLSWSAGINILSSISGFYCTIPANSIQLLDGQLFYANIVRNPTSNTSISISIVSALNQSTAPDDALMIAYRSGDTVFFNNGRIISDGESGDLFSISTFMAGVMPLQGSYEVGNTITTDSTNGALIVSGTENITLSGAVISETATTIKNQGNVLLKSGKVLIDDNYPTLNSGYVTDAPKTGGLVVNYDPTTTTTIVAGSYIAGVAATSNPRVTTAGSNTFTAGDIIMISNATHNNGLYEVSTHAGTLLTVKGIGTVATVELFTNTQFTAGATDGASIYKITISVLRTGTDGLWETGAGAVTPLVFTDLNAAATITSTAGTSGEALLAGNLVALANSGGNPRVFKADSNDTTTLMNAAGFNISAVGSSGSTVYIQTQGEISLADALWDALPAVTDAGKRVYMSETAGKVTLTAPSTSGSYILRVGIVSRGGTGAVKIVIQIGELFVA